MDSAWAPEPLAAVAAMGSSRVVTALELGLQPGAACCCPPCSLMVAEAMATEESGSLTAAVEPGGPRCPPKMVADAAVQKSALQAAVGGGVRSFARPHTVLASSCAENAGSSRCVASSSRSPRSPGGRVRSTASARNVIETSAGARP